MWYNKIDNILSYPSLYPNEYNKSLILNNLWNTAESYKSVIKTLLHLNNNQTPDYAFFGNFFYCLYFYMRFITEAFCSIEETELKKIRKSPYFVKILYRNYENGITSNIISNKNILNNMVKFFKGWVNTDFEDTIIILKKNWYNIIMEVKKNVIVIFRLILIENKL